MMSENKCPQCGAPIEVGATECKFCGEKLVTQKVTEQVQQAQQSQPQPQPQIVVQQVAPATVSGINPSWPVKSKTVAGILGIFFGGLGLHKFYMGKPLMGILYLCLSWTFVPEVIGFFEGISYLCSSDENFQLKNHVRIG